MSARGRMRRCRLQINGPTIDHGWTFDGLKVVTRLWEFFEQRRSENDDCLRSMNGRSPDRVSKSGNWQRHSRPSSFPIRYAPPFSMAIARARCRHEYTGGLGEEGVKALREFVEAGGTLVCLNRASDFAIEQFKLPVRNVVDGLPRTDFYVPGSILRIELDTTIRSRKECQKSRSPGSRTRRCLK